jgi:hypothetical protein
VRSVGHAAPGHEAVLCPCGISAHRCNFPSYGKFSPAPTAACERRRFNESTGNLASVVSKELPMEKTALSQDQNIRANQQKDLQDRMNEPPAQTHPQRQSGADPDQQLSTGDESRPQGADRVRRVNEAQRDQQMVQNPRNQLRSGSS